MKKIAIAAIGLLILVCVVSGFTFRESAEDKELKVADFRFDINKLSEVALVLGESNPEDAGTAATPFGADSREISIKDINPDLRKVLVQIADTDKDSKLSADEWNSMNIRRIDSEMYRKELAVEQFSAINSDPNLKNYLVITHGAYKGTVLYNGENKFVDSENQRFFGLNIFEKLQG